MLTNLPTSQMAISDTLCWPFRPDDGKCPPELKHVSISDWSSLNNDDCAKIPESTQNFPTSLIRIFNARDRFSAENGVISNGDRSVILESLHNASTEELHLLRLALNVSTGLPKDLFYRERMAS